MSQPNILSKNKLIESLKKQNDILKRFTLLTKSRSLQQPIHLDKPSRPTSRS